MKKSLTKLQKERKETVRELESHATHLVSALGSEDYPRAQFHANNAQSCLKILLQEMARQIGGI